MSPSPRKSSAASSDDAPEPINAVHIRGRVTAAALERRQNDEADITALEERRQKLKRQADKEGVKLTPLTLEPGLHVVTERSFGGDETARVAAVREAWPREPSPEALQRTLRLPQTYLFFPDFNYGTRSSMVLLGGPARTRLFWAEGQPPAPPAFSERPDLVAALK